MALPIRCEVCSVPPAVDPPATGTSASDSAWLGVITAPPPRPATSSGRAMASPTTAGATLPAVHSATTASGRGRRPRGGGRGGGRGRGGGGAAGGEGRAPRAAGGAREGGPGTPDPHPPGAPTGEEARPPAPGRAAGRNDQAAYDRAG